MINNKELEELKAFASESTFSTEESLKNYTTFQVGGKADAFLSVTDEEELKKVLPYLRKKQIPYFVLGNGSNVLISDRGYAGVILSMGKNFSKIWRKGNRLIAEAGALLSSVASLAQKNSLTGMEFASGIPGSIGGAVVMNAGAYEGEMKQIVESVTVITATGEQREYSGEEMCFSYRHSRLIEEDSVVVRVSLSLQPGDQEAIIEKTKILAGKRREKQPLQYPSAGSTFQRPEGYFAGKLIMDAGLAGFSIGAAEVSSKHCGFIINKGNATAKDIYSLICYVQKVVKEKYSVDLKPEVIFLGEMEKIGE